MIDMKVSTIDASSMSSRQIRKALSEIRNECNDTALILIGHGSESGTEFMNLSSTQILECNIRPAILWFFACNCGKFLVRDIAAKGITTVGHICNVIIDREDTSAIEAIEETLANTDSNTSHHQSIESTRTKWFILASNHFINKKFFSAAITNQLRLSMRYY